MRTEHVLASLALLIGTGSGHAERPPATPPLMPTTALKVQLQALTKPVLMDYKPRRQIWAAFPDSSAHFYMPLEAGNCYWFMGSGGSGVQDVDMYLFDARDSRVADDRSNSVDMKIHYCPPSTGQFHVELKLKKGKGEVAMQVLGRNAAIHEASAEPGSGRPTAQVGAKPAAQKKKNAPEGVKTVSTTSAMPAQPPAGAAQAPVRPIAQAGVAQAGAAQTHAPQQTTGAAQAASLSWPEGPQRKP